MQDVYDNLSDLYGGMNGNVLSAKAGERQYYKGVNVTCRGGTIRTRPAFNMIDLVFKSYADQMEFEHGKFQGCGVYVLGSETYLICGISGTVFLINPITGSVQNMSEDVGRLAEMNDRLYFCQVERYFIVQDGINSPLVINGSTVHLADATINEVPVGTIMAYGHGRLFIKTDVNEFVAGDINKPLTPAAVLCFTESGYLSGGGAFGFPNSLGEITGMVFIQAFDTATGQGPLVVFGKSGFMSFDVYNPRSYWTEQDIGKVQLQGVGCSSKDGIVVANEDLIFRSYSGIASYQLVQSDARTYRRFLDMSAEMYPFENQETEWLRPLSSAVLFDNRILYTLVGEKSTAISTTHEEIDDYRFRAIGSLDLAPIDGLTQDKTYPNGVYDGIWTGINPTMLIAGNFDDERRCFAFGKKDNGKNTLHEITKKQGLDCGIHPIKCRIYTRHLSFIDYSGPTPATAIYHNKLLNRAHMFLHGVEGTINFDLYARPDKRCDFTKISTMTIMAPTVYSPPPYDVIADGISQGRAKFGFPDLIPKHGDPIFGRDILTGYEFEFCVEWTGTVNIARIGFEAAVIEEVTQIGCETEGKLLPETILDDFDYNSSCPDTLYFGNYPSKRFWSIWVYGIFTVSSTTGTVWVIFGGTSTTPNGTVLEEDTEYDAGTSGMQLGYSTNGNANTTDDTQDDYEWYDPTGPGANISMPTVPGDLPTGPDNTGDSGGSGGGGEFKLGGGQGGTDGDKPQQNIPAKPQDTTWADTIVAELTCPSSVCENVEFDATISLYIYNTITKLYRNYTGVLGETVMMSVSDSTGVSISAGGTITWTRNVGRIAGVKCTNSTTSDQQTKIHASVPVKFNSGNASTACTSVTGKSSMTIKVCGGKLQLSGSLSWITTAGSTPPTKTATITNIGITPLVWTASIVGLGHPLSLNVAGGTLAAGASQDVIVTLAPAGMSVGTYLGDFHVEAGADIEAKDLDYSITIRAVSVGLICTKCGDGSASGGSGTIAVGTLFTYAQMYDDCEVVGLQHAVFTGSGSFLSGIGWYLYVDFNGVACSYGLFRNSSRKGITTSECTQIVDPCDPTGDYTNGYAFEWES